MIHAHGDGADNEHGWSEATGFFFGCRRGHVSVSIGEPFQRPWNIFFGSRREALSEATEKHFWLLYLVKVV